MIKQRLLLPAFLGIILIGLLTFVIAENNYVSTVNPEDRIACTMDAKMCSDGSYVGRIAPDCEFASCPGNCVCPSGYIADGDICNPKCYYNQPPCLAPSIKCRENGNDTSTDNENETEHPIVGSSCGTVTPGENNECCINKGYSGWDEEEFKCIGEKNNEDEDKGEKHLLGASNKDENECEAWNCTKWSTCVNGTETRKCLKKVSNCTEDNEKPRIVKDCSEKEELREYNKTRDCPEECVCSGSTIKCMFEDGTREMTVYAGKSGNVIVQIKNINMSTNVTLYKGENEKVYGVFKNNETKEIKLPDEIKEKLQNHTRAKLYNESINLTEDGYYQIEGKKKARLFWLVPVREHMKAEINAETGETIKIRNPWWGFMARDIKEKDNFTEA